MINRNALRSALTAGLANGFASVTSLPDIQYVSMAVLAVSSGTYGATLELGRQRLWGTVLGSVLLLIGHSGLQGMPIGVGLAITLGALRLLGGLLGLRVGYKVGGMIVVMGWLVHGGDLASWIPLRFFWTALGVLVMALSLRLFWPAQGSTSCLNRYADVLHALAGSFRQHATRLNPEQSPQGPPAARMSSHQLRALLQSARSLRSGMLPELGNQPERHPLLLLVTSLDAAASRLVTMAIGLERAAPTAHDPQPVIRLHQAESQLLESMAEQILRWERPLRGCKGLPQPPAVALQVPSSWLSLDAELITPLANTASLEQLERIAVRLMLCRQAEQAIRDGEASWSRILGPG